MKRLKGKLLSQALRGLADRVEAAEVAAKAYYLCKHPEPSPGWQKAYNNRCSTSHAALKALVAVQAISAEVDFPITDKTLSELDGDFTDEATTFYAGLGYQYANERERKRARKPKARKPKNRKLKRAA